MPISRQLIEACLMRLRAAGIRTPESARSAEGFSLMLGVWCDKLGSYEPRFVQQAFDRWLDDHAEWPVPSKLIPIVLELQRAAQPAIAAKPAPKAEEPPPRPRPTHEDIRLTCKLVEEVRGNPAGFLAPHAIVAMGETLIGRNILAGYAPPDVADWYRHLGEREAARQAEEVQAA